MKTIAILLLGLVMGASGAHAAIPQYNIQARLNEHDRLIQAKQKVTFTNTQDSPLDELYFHIYPNRTYTAKEKSFMMRYASYFNIDPFPEGFDTGAMSIHGITAQGQALSYVIEGKDNTLLKIQLPIPLAKGEQVTVEIDFTTKIPHAYGRFGWHEGIFAMSHWYPILSVLTAKGWDKHPFYPFHRPFYSEASLYQVELTVPSTMVVVASGDQSQEEVQGDQKIIRISDSLPLRSFTFSASRYYQQLQQEQDGVNLSVYYLKGQEKRAADALTYAGDMMRFYGQKFSPYPYKNFKIAAVHLGYGGEQMAGMIFIDTRVFHLPKALNRHFDFLIAHETGHQWFYNVIGVNNYQEMWLEEGINSYFLLEHLENKYGFDASVVDWKTLPPFTGYFLPDFSFRRAQDTRYKASRRMGFDRPIVSDLGSFNQPSFIFALTYGKGARVMGMLKHEMGQEAFEAMIKELFEGFQFKNLSLEELIALANKHAKRDLTEFFQQWLKTDKYLDWRITRVDGQKVTVNHRGGILMDTLMRVEYPDGASEDIVLSSQEQEQEVVLSKRPKRVVIDPEHQLLDLDRVNNQWPANVHLNVRPIYHGLYDIPTVMKDDGYNINMGPSFDDGIGVKAAWHKPYDYQVFVSTHYDINESIQRTVEGFEIKNIRQSPLSVGVEAMQAADYDGGEDDLTSEKVYIRQELWPAAFSLFDVNDHATLYMVRNRTPKGTFGNAERLRNTSYQLKDESIVGLMAHFSRAKPTDEPQGGYTVDALIENAGHFMGATQAFTRASIDVETYHVVTSKSQMAYRVKYGWGSSDDKNLFELGGAQGLRGYDRKEVRGANALMGITEYRFPLIKDLQVSMLDHWLTLTKLGGVVFFDGGQVWGDEFDQGKFKKNVGVGLRTKITIGAFLEDILLRIDVAKAINDHDQDPQVWFGINHAF